MALQVGNRSRTTLSEINVTPLVDVMLVLLIIFMVTAPMLQQGIEVQLPSETGEVLPTEQNPLVITVQDENRLYLNDQRVSLITLESALLEAARSQTEVLLRADVHVPYGVVMRIMALTKKVGVEKLGMVTDPFEK